MRDMIIAEIKKQQVIVVVSETGSGKTTQLPKMVAEALSEGKKMIAVTQPRRIAAVSVAKRVAEELQETLGGYVGYQVRFDEKTSRDTKIKFMTDGILLAETQGDKNLSKYDAIILDEAHERSLNIDFLLGYLKILLEKRKELRLIISSATLDAGAFSEFFHNAPVIEAEGRTFPVEEHFLSSQNEEELPQHICRAVEWLNVSDPQGDVLVFLPGEKEIRDSADALEGKKFHHTEILPLYARLGLAEQQRIFTPGKMRRIILATNVAETSLTIPRISSVVDSGLARVSRWNPSRGVQRLTVEPVSQASARQRKGRCGRIKEGICVRLYGEDDLLDRSEFTDPEIRRSSLAGVILRMISLGLPEITEFPLIDPPQAKAVAEGYRTLREIGALLDREYKLTDWGLQMARMPIEPRLARILLEAKEEKCLADILPIVSALESNDPRERPPEKAKEADAAHSRWRHEKSDFLTILKMWRELNEYRDARGWKRNQLRKFCGTTFLNYRRVTEWANVHDELCDLLENELKWKWHASKGQDLNAIYDVVHRSLLAGVPRQFGLWNPQERHYHSAAGVNYAVFPGSALFSNKRDDWTMAMEMVETSRLWARRVAMIDPTWLEQVAPQLCRTHHSEGFWDVEQGAVYAKESVTCGNLTIVPARRVHLGRIDPVAAREVFIREALLTGNIKGDAPSMKQLKKLRSQVADVEMKIRRRDFLWSDEKILDHFSAVIPAGMCTAKQFHDWRKNDEAILHRELADVVWDEYDLPDERDFPDELDEYAVYYVFDPSRKDDGVTFGVHIDQLGDFSNNLLEWGVPGNLPQRVECLVRALPKDIRKACSPIDDFVDDFLGNHQYAVHEKSLRHELLDFIKSRVPYPVHASDIDFSRLPNEWISKLWVCDDEGKELAFGTDAEEIKSKLSALMKKRIEHHANDSWQEHGLLDFPTYELPLTSETNVGIAYPALVDEGDSVGVKAFHCAATAAHHHRRGCMRLLLISQKDQTIHLRKNFPIGLAARVEMPRIGTGLTLDNLIELTAATLLENHAPRTAEAFHLLVKKFRGHWHDAAVKVGATLDAAVETSAYVRQWISQNETSRHLADIADDLSMQHHFLLEGNISERIHSHYLRYMMAIRQRIDRLSSLPIAKDLEKMKRFHQVWLPWYERFEKKPSDPALWKIGYHLEELRIATFAPNMPHQALSMKQIESLLA